MQHDLPPGFRFHPTDEELILYYLCNQYTSKPCPAASSIIPEVDIYKFDPSDLPIIKKAGFGEKEWYFFSPRERKYPNGVRPNRANVSGYWKATGTDKAIYSGCKNIGVKKSLVFYKGKPPKGIKTGWIMHEYRLVESTTSQANKHVGSMRLDDWVLCRIYKKKMGKTTTMEGEREEFPSNYQNEQEMMDNNRMGSVPQIFSDGQRYDNYSTFDLHQNNVSWSNSGIVDEYCSFVKPQIFAEEDYGGKFQVMKQSSSVVNSNQPMFMIQVYHL